MKINSISGSNPLYGLQLFRGLAAILVVFFHAAQFLDNHYKIKPINGFFNFGFSGVHLFFVLSGFIIYWIHASDIGQPRQLILFATKRFIRIYPTYWIVLGVLSIFGLYNGTINFNDIFLNLGILHTELFINAVCWTLAFEIFFYLIFSLLLISRTLGLIFSGYWLLGIILRNFYPEYNFFAIQTNTTSEAIFINLYANKFLFHNYTILFAFGIGAAYLTIKLSNLRQEVKDFIGLTSLFFGIFIFALIIEFCWTSNTNQGDTLNLIIIIGFGSSLLMLSVLSSRLDKMLARRKFFVLLGNASYSIYLIHYPLLFWITYNLSSELLKNDYDFISLIFVAITSLCIFIGIVFHVFVERPLLKLFRENSLKYAYKISFRLNNIFVRNIDFAADRFKVAESKFTWLFKKTSIFIVAISSIFLIGLGRADLVNTSYPLMVNVHMEDDLIKYEVGPYTNGQYFAITPTLGRTPIQQTGEVKLPVEELSFFIQYESEKGWVTSSPLLKLRKEAPVVWERTQK